jgi:hypothetical protein
MDNSQLLNSKGKLQVLPANIRPGCKCLPGEALELISLEQWQQRKMLYKNATRRRFLWSMKGLMLLP